MYRLAQLTDQIPQIAQPKLDAPGIGMWLAWEGTLSTIVGQIFTDFGGFQQIQDGNQALWFFFGDEAFKALGRLSGYARVNRLPILIQTFPASLVIGYNYELSFSCAQEFSNQEADPSQDLEILVHPHFNAMIESLPGFGIKPMQGRPGLAPGEFGLLSVDATMGHDSPLGWYYMLRPLGDPLDKNDADGWRAIFSELQTLLERLALKYMSNEGYLIFALDNIRALRNVTRELLKLEGDLRQPESGKKYWPCIVACVLKKGYHLNKDLPKRINLDWKQVAPDYPHMSFKSALYLGKGFRINDVRHSSSTLDIDSWCHISLAPEEDSEEPQGELPFKLPSALMTGTNPPCFYCGLSSHQPRDCPTRALTERNPAVWSDLGMVDLAKLEQAGIALNKDMAGAEPATLTRIIDGQDIQGLILRGLFEQSFAGQLRSLSLIWRSKGKDLPDGFDNLVPYDEGEFLWSALDMLRKRDDEGFERELTQGLAKHGRGFQPRSIQGFLAMEQGDWSRSAYFWQEAARSAFTPLQRGWLAYLEGRSLEVQGEYQKAMGFYQQARSECPRWIEPQYRYGVCMVKMGFTGQGLHHFLELLRSDANIFNRLLLDPEVERGRVSILAALWKPWSEALVARDDKATHLAALPAYLKSWFKEDHPFLKKALDEAKVLDELAKINNYVCFHQLVQAYDKMQKDLQQTVEKGIVAIDHRLKAIHEELKNIHHEAAWFPFGKLLREFNKDFNSCASKLNWMRTSSLQVAANFRKSQDYIEEIDTTITLLRARLVTLRIVRDATLFLLLLGKSFMWIELVGLALSLIAVPAIIYFAQKTGQYWLAGVMEAQKWQVQKGLVIIVSIVAMSFAAIKTAFGFEKRRAELFKEEEDKAGAFKGGSQAKGKPAPKALPTGNGGAVAAKPGGGKPVASKGKGK